MTLDKSLNDSLRERFNPPGSQLRKVQMRLLDMLKTFDALCRRHGIKYWLSSGTCLGALRHGGFIPWDDDVDIDMEYSDFLRLRRILRKTPPQGFEYQDRHSDSEYMLVFPKLRDLNSHIDELNGQDKNWRLRGCYIDIFPLVPSGSRILHALSCNAYNTLVYRASRIKSQALRRVALQSGYTLFYGIATPLFRMLGRIGAGSRMRHMPGSCYIAPRDARNFKTVRYVPFEDTELPVPVNAEAYLTDLFGDWQKLPDISQIETHIHHVTLS